MTSEINQNFNNSTIGNVANTNSGHMSSTQNIYDSRVNDISQVMSTLRSQAQSFPIRYRNDLLDTINDLEIDVSQPVSEPDRIGRRMKRLIAIASTMSAIAGGAATFSGDIKDFTSNINALAENIGIPIEQIQPSETSEP